MYKIEEPVRRAHKVVANELSQIKRYLKLFVFDQTSMKLNFYF